MKSPRSVIGVFLLLAGIALAAAGVLVLLQPNVYKAVVTIAVFPLQYYPDNSYNPYFLLTEFETIQSHAVLKDVIAELKLDALWGNKYNHGKKLSASETEAMIKRRLDMRNIRNTKLIEISVFDNDPIEAAKLANAIARQYREYRVEEFSLLASKAGKSSEPLKYQPPEVVDAAVPQVRPVRPNRYLGGAMFGGGLFLMVAGIRSLKRAKN